jgi:hypothetical protein
VSTQREVWLVCDVCDTASSVVGTGIDTVKDAREHGQDQGWHFVKRRDICQDCWEAGER